MDCQSGKVVHTLKTAKAASKRARHRTELPLTPLGNGMTDEDLEALRRKYAQ